MRENDIKSVVGARVHPGSFCLMILQTALNPAKDPGLTQKNLLDKEVFVVLAQQTTCLLHRSPSDR